MWILDIVLDAVLDCLKELPFLFAAFYLLEVLEHRTADKMNKTLSKAGGLGPLAGALMGCVPQCGFSIMASNFYAGGVISLGALLSVYLSTSDEALVILLANPDQFVTVIKLVVTKIVIALIAGYLVYAAELVYLRSSGRKRKRIRDLCETDRCGCEHPLVDPERAQEEAQEKRKSEAVAAADKAVDSGAEVGSVGADEQSPGTSDSGAQSPGARTSGIQSSAMHTSGTQSSVTRTGSTQSSGTRASSTQSSVTRTGEKKRRRKPSMGWKALLKPAWHHTREVILFLFIFTLILNLLLEVIGMEHLSRIFLANSVFQPALASLIGLIPNCAASVILTELYMEGVISFGSAIAGLCSSAGLGLIVLWRVNRDRKESLRITVLLLVLSVLAGIICQAIGV